MNNLPKPPGKWWCLAGIASVLLVPGPSAQAQSSVTNGVVAYWNFDKQDFTDSVGKFDGTGNGTSPITFVAGKAGFGQAMQLDGVDEFVEITGRDASYDPDQLAFSGGSITIAGWFTVGTFDKSWQALIAKGEGTNWRVHRNSANPSMAYAGGIGEGPADGPDVTDGNWHHFAAVTDATAANFGTCIYIDGVQTSVNTGTPSLATNGKNMKIGDNPDATGRYWNGKVDDLAIWNRVLTEAEIQALYNNGAGKPLSSFFVAVPPSPLAVVGTVPAPNAPRASFKTPISITFQNGTTVLDTNKLSMKLDNTNVTATVATQGTVVTYSYQPASIFAALSTHTVAVSYGDTNGGTFSTNWSFTVQNYPTLDPSLRVTPDRSKPGFLDEMSQVDSVGNDTQNSIQRVIDQLAGLLGPNTADPGAQGIAIGQGTPNSDPNLPIDFEISTVINLSASGNTGDFPPGDQMPGSPGTGGGTDNQAARIITYVDLPAGMITMGVNSDDNFRTEVGYWNDAFTAQMLGQFDAGGRGIADTLFNFFVSQPGVYPMFTLWENGGGGSDVTWFTVKADGTKVLLNDTTNGGFKAYRSVQGGPKSVAYGRTVIPAPNATDAAPNRIRVELVDGATPIDSSTVKLKLDNTAVAATVNKSSNVTTIAYSPSPALASQSSHTAELDYTESGAPVARQWSFTVVTYPTLSPTMLVTPDTTKSGFLWRIHQTANAEPNTIGWAEDELAGKHGANIADPNAQGIALGKGVTATNNSNLIQFEIPTVINLSITASDPANPQNNGNFTPDQQMPGTPGTTGSTDNLAAEIFTYITLPAGVVTMGVNSDDGFLTTAGPIGSETNTFLGEFNGGRGFADTIFYFAVPQAGTYPFRTVWENGTGGANIEWFTVKADGTKVLLNDTNNGGFSTYRVATPAPVSGTTTPTLSFARGANGLTLTFTGTLQSADKVGGPWTDVTGSSPQTVPTTGTEKYFRAKQ